jgi:hypothetical protein
LDFSFSEEQRMPRDNVRKLMDRHARQSSGIFRDSRCDLADTAQSACEFDGT